MLKKLYDKNEIWFAAAWIIAYCVLMSAGDALSSLVGMEKSVSLPVGLTLSVILFSFLKRHGLLCSYGLCKSKVPAQAMIYYIPVIIMLTANLWHGVTLNYAAVETTLYILTMFSVGFLEEVIFRGLLFGAMRKDSLKAAVIVSSVTFGVGHIINLFNGSGAELIPNLLQVVYATAAGFMFVMIYCKTDSLILCIIAHGLFNGLSVFANTPKSVEIRISTCLLLTFITASYGIYIALGMKIKNRRP